MTGAQVIVEKLLENNVDVVFGYPGSSILPLYDELYNVKDKINHILTANEQGAAHAADGYARVTKKAGVVIATSGPGATNIVTGIATAHMDSIPLVVITANVTNSKLGKDSFQEIDILSITMPITKHNFIIKDAKDIPNAFDMAFHLATEGRNGPVLIDITGDALVNEVNLEELSSNKFSRVSKQKDDLKDEAKLLSTLKLLKEAKHPLIIAGGGVRTSKAEAQVEEIAKLFSIPVAHTMNGLFTYKEDIEDLGLVGNYSQAALKRALKQCDVLLAIGTRFSDRSFPSEEVLSKKCKIIHIDADSAEINKNFLSTFGFVGDAKEVLKKLIDTEMKLNGDYEKKEIKSSKKTFSSLIPKEATDKYKKEASLLYSLKEYVDFKEDLYMVSEVGLHQMCVATLFDYLPSHFLASGGLGTMGYGLPAAIGAAIAKPGYKIVTVSGDGCFRMDLNELATVARYKLGVIILVMNDKRLGMVNEIQQKKFSGHTYCTEFDDGFSPAKIAKAFNIKSFVTRNKSDLKKRFKEALESNEACLIEVLI
ncbi:MAG: thiamine pyrophosphate-binding protein [Lachnospiraceae bacterium]|nr:thiamine pyrophosphate-binding protein [Lachnospiraceae bacterium]